MGVMNNKIEIDKLRKGSGGADLEERLSHLEDEFTKLATYSSTEEKSIGEWVDGKTIYRKSFQIDSGNTLQLPDDTDKIVKCDFIAKISEYSYALNAASEGSSYYVNATYNDSTKRILFTLNGWTITQYMVTLEYTKNEE